MLRSLHLLSRRRFTNRYEKNALLYRSAGSHPYAIHLASRSVQVWRPLAAEYPARLARALAVLAACLHTRGRAAEAYAAIEESLTLCDRARGPATVLDLRWVADALVELDRGDEALALTERIVNEAGSAATSEQGWALVGYGRMLLLQGRPEEAITVLQEAAAHSRRYGAVDVAARYLLFDALGKAGRHDELEKRAAEDLWHFGLIARFSMANRKRYIALLTALSQFWSLAGRTRNRQTIDASLTRHKRVLHRQMARRRALLRVMEAIQWVGTATTRRRARSAAHDRRQRAVYEAELEDAVAAEVAKVQRCRQLGDARALADALAQLAEARWRTGRQRSAALTAQREVVDLTRRLAEADPGGMRPILARRLLRLAEWAEAIGLRSDAQAARTEADLLPAG